MCSLDWDVQIACEEERLKNFSMKQTEKNTGLIGSIRRKDSEFFNIFKKFCKDLHVISYYFIGHLRME